MHKSKAHLQEEIEKLARFEQMCADLADFFADHKDLPTTPYLHKALIDTIERGGDVIATYRMQLTDTLETYNPDPRDERGYFGTND